MAGKVRTVVLVCCFVGAAMLFSIAMRLVSGPPDPIETAIVFQDVEDLKQLATAGRDVNVLLPDGKTALHAAANGRNHEGCKSNERREAANARRNAVL